MDASNPPQSTTKNAPHLHSVATSLRSCLDGMLPDDLRNDTTAFQEHLNIQKNRIQTEKNSWRFGLNYIFETLKQHKEWYGRNQQYVQLKKDVTKLENHCAAIQSILSESISKLDLEAGLRIAELEGRVGAYKIMFEVTKIVTKLSRPLVKLQILKPSDSAISIYCDTFVLDIVLSGGEGAVESASLMTVEKDQTKQYPDRDEDLLRSLRLLAAGESSKFTEKLVRLINRAELAVKYTSINFEQLEEEIFAKITEACSTQSHWTVKRGVDGILLHFKDLRHCTPIVEPVHKKFKGQDPFMEKKKEENDFFQDIHNNSSDAETKVNMNPLTHGVWTGSMSFIEWRGEIALHFVGYTPLVMVGVQAQRLALAALKKDNEQPFMTEAVETLGTTKASSQEDQKLFNEFVSWTTPDGKKPILPHLHFARDQSVCTVFPFKTNFAMCQSFSLITKEISGGLQINSFPIPLTFASIQSLRSIFQICGHSLFFHSVLLSAFCSKSITFGRKLSPETTEEAVSTKIFVDVAAPERITLKIVDIFGPEKNTLLLDIGTKMDCTIELSLKFAETTSKNEEIIDEQEKNTSTDPHKDTVTVVGSKEILDKLAITCHSIPLLTFYILRKALEKKCQDVSNVPQNADDCNGIATLDDDGLSASLKMEQDELMLDEMQMF